MPPDPKTPKAPVTRVLGGTTTSAQDREIQLFMEDTRRRQAELDADKAAAANPGPGGLGALKTHDIGQPGTSAVAVVGFKTGLGDEVQYMQVDVTASETAHGNVDLTFVYVCPRCVARGIPQTMAQVAVRQSNRKWHLDTSCQGEMFFDEKDGSVYRLAGKVYCEERCVCPNPSCDGVYKFGDWPAKALFARPHTTYMWREDRSVVGGRP